MSHIVINPLHSDHVIDCLNKQTPLTISRWGDGEWYSALGRTTGTNCDGHQYFAEMGTDLAGVLRRRPAYTMCLQPFVMRLMGEKITNWLIEHNLEDIKWFDADVFHRSAIRGDLESVLEALNRQQVVMVGPQHLRRLQVALHYTKYVEVPAVNCYLEKQRIVQDILTAVESLSGHVVVAISSGMPAEAFIDALYPLLGAKHSLIDFGSVWDPLVGVLSRTYMRKPEYKYSDISSSASAHSEQPAAG